MARIQFTTVEGYLDDETFLVYAEIMGRLGDPSETSSRTTAYVEQNFYVNVTGSGTGTGIEIDLTSSSTAAEVAAQFLASWNNAANILLPFFTATTATPNCEDTTQVALIGNRPGYDPGMTITTLGSTSWTRYRTQRYDGHPAVSLGGISGPRRWSVTIDGGSIVTNTLKYFEPYNGRVIPIVTGAP